VRQLDLPGPALPRALHAASRGLFSLSQPGCQHPEGAARRWKPGLAKGLAKQGKHEALADIYESIEELKYYRESFLKL